MLQVQFYSLIRLLLEKKSVEIPWAQGDTVTRVLQRTQDMEATPFLHKLLDREGRMHLGTIILVNRHNVRHLQGLETTIEDGDTLALFPPGAGG